MTQESQLPSGTAAPAGAGSAAYAAVLSFAVATLRAKRFVAAVPAALFILVVGWTLLKHKTYTSHLAFNSAAPSAALGSLGALASLSALGGLGLTQESPQFYVDLVNTEHVLRRLAQMPFTVRDGDETLTGSVISLYEIDERTPERSLYEAVRLLRERILTARPNRVTGVTEISVETRWPELSVGLAQAIQAEIESYNIGARNAQARSERVFLEARVDSARLALREAEGRLQAFLEANRTYRDNARLLFDSQRLQRELDVRQDTYLTLTRALVQARTDEVRNTMSINIVEAPTVPLRYDPRHTAVKGALMLFLGFFGALAALALREALQPTVWDRSALIRALHDELRRLPFGTTLTRYLDAV